MSDRLEELSMRRRRLLLRSERLRGDLAADQRVMLDALSGVDRAISIARKAAKPLLLVGAGVAMKALFWVSMARRSLPYVAMCRDMWRSRSSQRAEVPAEAEQPR